MTSRKVFYWRSISHCALYQNRNAVFIWSVEMCFIFVEQLNVILMRPIYEAVIMCDCIIKGVIRTKNKINSHFFRRVFHLYHIKHTVYKAICTLHCTRTIALINRILKKDILIIEPPHDKTNKMACAPSEDSDQPRHPPSLINLHCPHEESLGP